MNPERLQLKGMLAESKKRFRTLDTEKALVSMQKLNTIQTELKNLEVKIRNLEAELD